MSRYTGPRLRILRRIGKLRGFTRKKPFRRIFKGKGPMKGKVIPPGQHGLTKLFKTKPSDYLIRLKVKQRLRFNYGVSEKQLVRYVRKAKKMKESTGQVLLQMLEMRLDNIVFRLNMAPTIVAARQLIVHGHILVNEKKVDIPSYATRVKDVISVRPKKSSLTIVTKNLNTYYREVAFYKKRLEKTLAFLLIKLNIASDMSTSLQLISSGNISVNNRKITAPNFVLSAKDTISFIPKNTNQAKKGIVRKIRLNEYLN